jgi:hypothetical protein
VKEREKGGKKVVSHTKSREPDSLKKPDKDRFA